MNPHVRTILLILVDSLLLSAILMVLPFAWILKDGLGPSAVTSTGFTALSRVFMTFYVGPAILLLTAFDLLLRRGIEGSTLSRKKLLIPALVVLILAALGAIAYKVASRL